ncbi:MAG TPA: metal ABC transporter ATP-binding protein [Acidimicrobiia bacterium]|nr:metal ABC transporter ATP-binding protein [Acidimicrobiia bacterium]
MPVDSPAAMATDLVLKYGSTVALAESSFSLPGAGVTVVIGPNGSGKSTVLAAIAGLHRPAGGAVRTLAQEPTDVRSRVAFVPQSTKVNDALPVTVREVVAMGRYSSLGLIGRFGDDDREALEQALERLDLVDLQARHLRELSGGQRQRVFVAQGLVQEREMLLLDEPTMALDVVSARVIHEAIADEARRERPVVVTTHDFGEARQADYVLLLAGRVVAEGAPEQVLTAEHLAAAYGFAAGDLEGHLHLDDAAHQPAARRHVHGKPAAPTRPGGGRPRE